AGGDHRAARPPLVRRLAIPPGIPLPAEPSASTLPGLRQGGRRQGRCARGRGRGSDEAGDLTGQDRPKRVKSDLSTPASGNVTTPRTVQPNLGIELVRATEAAALSAGRWMGNLDREGIRGTAANAMREALTGVHLKGTIVIGEESVSAPLGLGQTVGDGCGDACDVALNPLDGSTLVAKVLPNAVSVIATAERGSLVRAPVGLYAEKIAVGPEARGSVDVTDSVENNLQRV